MAGILTRKQHVLKAEFFYITASKLVLCYYSDFVYNVSGNMQAECKSIFIGASIGKTSLINRLLNLNFSTEYEPTIGVSFVNAQNTSIQYWDTPGQQHYTTYCQFYYRKSHIALLCFDPRDEESFNFLASKLELFKQEAETDYTLILVETKADRTDGVLIDEERIVRFKLAHDIQHHVITSARRGNGIDELLKILSNLGAEKQEQSTMNDFVPLVMASNNLKLEPEDKQHFSATLLFDFYAYYAISGTALLIAAIVIASSMSLPLAAAGVGLLGLALLSFFKAPSKEVIKDNSTHPERSYYLHSEIPLLL